MQIATFNKLLFVKYFDDKPVQRLAQVRALIVPGHKHADDFTLMFVVTVQISTNASVVRTSASMACSVKTQSVDTAAFVPLDLKQAGEHHHALVKYGFQCA